MASCLLYRRHLAVCKLAREPGCVPGQLANISLPSPVPDPQDLGVSEHWLRLLNGRWREETQHNEQAKVLSETHPSAQPQLEQRHTTNDSPRALPLPARITGGGVRAPWGRRAAPEAAGRVGGQLLGWRASSCRDLPGRSVGQRPGGTGGKPPPPGTVAPIAAPKAVSGAAAAAAAAAASGRPRRACRPPLSRRHGDKERRSAFNDSMIFLPPIEKLMEGWRGES